MLSKPSETKGERRRERIGGYAMSHALVEQWALRLLGEDEMSREDATASVDIVNFILDMKKNYDFKIRSVGEVSCVHCMIVTHRGEAKNAFVTTPASEIEQFVPNDADKKVLDFLEEQGFVEKRDFNFETWLN
ncbi:hypothetical protein GALMADRAFT_266486 [Galerina marginata CBS 339.88]|uniref:Uncharacterized protein n=1 Tax=Galerina marginata (strain CBS 339.88) TaxID=685588 RepID=A0A067TDC2_GALM3|nr:hypothetical protein GALMADRAFT_266486 [Galerina marginata CBS 339.88]